VNLEPKSNTIVFFNIFSLLYISSFLFHISKTGEQILWPACLIIFITVNIFSRSSVKKLVFILFLISSSLFQAYHFPQIANHSTLQLFINIFLLTKIFYKRNEPCENVIFQQKNILCYFLVWVYFIAGFHKLNIDFFNPDVSCANWYLNKLGHILGFTKTTPFGFTEVNLPVLIKNINPYFVVASEILGAALLLTYRKIGLFIFIIMHSFLAFGGFADFSAIAFSILICFLPMDLLKSFYKVNGHIKFAVFSVLTSVLAILFNYDFILRSMETHNFKFILGVGFMLSISPIFPIFYKGLPSLSKVNFTKLNLSKINIIFIITLVVFSINPYLGLSTAGTFSMFSNIKTENGLNNHYIMPNSQAFDYQKYNVEVISYEPDYLINRFSNEYMYPYKLFKSLLRDYLEEPDKHYNIKFKVNGKIMSLNEKTLPNSHWVKYNSWLERYYLNFRSFNKSPTPNTCKW